MKSNNCIFCNFSQDRIVFETEDIFLTFSLYPVSSYHVLIIPKRHIIDQQLNKQEWLDILKLKNKIVKLVNDVDIFEDYNFGVNQGSLAGQTIGHCHYHVIFREINDVKDPVGGIRNIILGKGNYKSGNVDKAEELVLSWIKEFKEYA